LIFKDFDQHGYLSSLIEDCPRGAIFHNPYVGSGGFVVPPSDYYLRPTVMTTYVHLYSLIREEKWCYQERLECEHYWQYILDQMSAFRARGNQPHFIFSLMGSISHDELNDVGYLDRPARRFLEQIFAAGHHQNTMIMFLSDHAIRGHRKIAHTTGFQYEQRLPLFYLYIPDSLTLHGLNSSQLRAIVHQNQHRLTSHLDLHATMMHVLTGKVPNEERYGKSLLTNIPTNRTCAQAGIPPQFCLCNSDPNQNLFSPLRVTKLVQMYSTEVVAHMNQILTRHGNHCVPLQIGATFRAYKWAASDGETEQVKLLLHFETTPNNGTFEAMILLDANEDLGKVLHITRTNNYGQQSHCAGSYEIVQYCLCWDVYERATKRKKTKD